MMSSNQGVWDEQAAIICEMRNTFGIFVGKLERKGLGMDGIQLALDRVHLPVRPIVQMVIVPRLPQKADNFLTISRVNMTQKYATVMSLYHG
jgi:hypothetical protein